MPDAETDETIPDLAGAWIRNPTGIAMDRIGRFGCILYSQVASLLVLAGVTMASVPSSSTSTLPAGLQLVGSSGSGVDVKGEAIVVVRDAGGSPILFSLVEILFVSCCSAPSSDIRLQPTQPYFVETGSGWAWPPGFGKPTAYATCDAQGRARFRIIGGAAAIPGNNPGITTPCALVRADGQVLGQLRVSAYDLNSSGGVNGADQSLLLSTLFAGPAGYRCRADYNGDGVVNGADLSKILSVQFGAGSLISGTAMTWP